MKIRLPDLIVTFEPDATLLVRSRTRGVGARVPLPAVGVLAFCSQPRTAEEAEAAMGPSGRQLYDGLADAGLLVDPEQATRTPIFFGNYADVDIHRRMLADEPRVAAYAEAIARVVRPGMAVLDAGTGNGILACLAARAGARVVYAVDASEMLGVATEVFARNGFADVIRPIRADLAEVVLPEKVDVVVTETFGLFALVEGAAADLRPCVERNLKPGGQVVPDGVELFLAPVGDLDVYRRTVGLLEEVRGLSFAPLAALAQHRAFGLDLEPGALLAEPRRWLELPWPGPGQGHGTLRFESLSAGTFCGLAGWFRARLADGVVLGTGPADPVTHWGQAFFPFSPVEVAADEVLEVDAEVVPGLDDRRAILFRGTWRIGDRGGRFEHRGR